VFKIFVIDDPAQIVKVAVGVAEFSRIKIDTAPPCGATTPTAVLVTVNVQSA